MTLFLSKCCRALAAAWCVAGSMVAAADGDESTPVQYPLAVIQAASVNQLHNRSAVMFSVAGHEEMSPQVDEWIKTTLHELRGMDRTRPFGMTLYLKSDFTGVAPVSFLPIENGDIDGLLHTLSNGTGNFRKVEGKTDRYSVEAPAPFQVRKVGNYAFLASVDDAAELQRNFPDPEQLTKKFAGRYDISASLLLRHVPPATRQLFVTFLQTAIEGELQQKDDEPDAAHRVRKANGESVLQLMEKVLTQGEELTLGGRVVEQTGAGEMELEVAGATDSKLAQFFQAMVGRRSLFANLLDQEAVFSLAVSLQLDEKQRKLFTELFTVAPEEIARISDKGGIEGTKAGFEPLFQTFLQAAEEGHLDAFVQLAGEGAGNFALIGAIRVPKGTNLPRQFSEALAFTKDKYGGEERIAALELDVATIDGLSVHKWPLSAPGRSSRWMYGENSRLYLYPTTQAVWLAFGGESAIDELKKNVEAAKKPTTAQEKKQPRIPLVFQTHARKWVTVQNEVGPGDRPGRGGERAQRMREEFRQEVNLAFEGGKDRLRAEFRPTDSGARIQFQFQPDWLALLGRSITLTVQRVREFQAERREARPQGQSQDGNP